MERLCKRIDAAAKTLLAFEKLVNLENPNNVEQDALIHRFKLSFEASWKAAKHYLYDIEGLDVGSPKSVIRRCRAVNLLKDDETVLALDMVNDRNLTVHAYNEEAAIKIQSNLQKYYGLLQQWVNRINDRVIG